MPHLQLELSSNAAQSLDVPAVLQALVAEFSTCPSIEAKNVKAYARIAENYAMGEAAPPGFVHLTVCVLDGRDEETLEAISDRMFETLMARCAAIINDNCAGVTLELREMPRWTYHKSNNM